MFIKQLYTGCLSEAAYYVESEGQAAIIDPLRDIDSYLQLATERNATIKYIFETHFHADFVSGHLDLQKATGAPIVYGPNTETGFPIHLAKDGETFQLGKLSIQVLHTPGHTLESTCYLLKDEAGKEHAVFTGDTLFVGDVGRPDLSSGNMSKEDLASLLYDSLQNRIATLPDDVIVYPAHGAGSSCGKNLGPETHSTIGEQKKTNYALQPQSREEFIRAVTDGLALPPQYFPINARINKEGYDSLDNILENGLKPLSIPAFKEFQSNEDVIVLDTRKASVFTSGFVPHSISVGLEGRFAEWAGSLLPFDKTIVLVTEAGKERETVVRLARVGFSKMEGYLEGGFEAWQQAGEEVDMIIDVEADELAMDLPFDQHLVVVDVRRETEFADGHIQGAQNIPLAEMTDPGNLATLEEHQNLYVHCAGGYRSVIAASIMKRQGIHNLRNVLGGWGTISKQEGIEIVKEKSVLN
ncbi:MBL fold metallo-hydrolase [Pseudobacter ginsenosidimutans]|jgi:glyoxylase-like metal-dependent hydrolase (beta-lactamase superfamily II)/rhodanese-related sulfurtransferase|uniref:Glyoxylase-like metal-dependent hydrolase (Beta-lactamase superfamily II) n=1 Tax=Pseudobacter ginsenosidimutans TaxID=661488 RepID=A0A4Q7MVR3_9BACT|nr:MBL fold metallo-hydrolase [Pseudobacter ginsenosidimutans]QEC41121.1 MBL fold metallo-hydrolase [Pseudobacter ginsenosidimutans]RZS72119.1 glyoxylase-like metal-dependent hydrolase (beta-lactamase superfamily II) [Pseudobacter ginsenosidimutans]